ncbi:blue light receptor, variant 2 [Schistosoma haematobium]|uniref:Blue light receptor, variant 2 n=1 Tax=Schistosoma haematobium TaxID=6185 RepID=A0A922S0K3_SCHHA|nr:blue light receptor, variant 2 [Schistosoma haematobium]KAH9587993.1 blue light receptor, variant 2 [Schistosoma haematobium]
MTKVKNLSLEQDENNQDVLEFENNLEKTSRDLVADILNRARSAIAHESLDTKQIMLPKQNFASSLPQLSITTLSPPKYVSENDKNTGECDDAFGITSINHKSVINEEIQPSNFHEELTIQQAPSEEKVSNQYQTKSDFKSNILNDFRGIGVGSATPDTPHQRDYQWKSSIDLPPANNTAFTHSYNYPQKPVYLREMSFSPPSLSYDLVKDDLITSSPPNNSNCIGEFIALSKMLTYRQDSPTVINTDDMEQKLKPFSSPLPIYIPSTACTRILKNSEVHRFTGDCNSQQRRLRHNDSEVAKLSYSDSTSSELEKISIEYKNNSFMTNKKQANKPNIPRLQLPSSPKLTHSPKTNQMRIRQSSLLRNSITSKSNSLKIPKSTSSSLCWWEPLNRYDAHIMEVEGINNSPYNDKFNLPEPNPEVLKHYYYLCAQQPVKEASLMKAINEAEIQAKYDKIAHYEFLRRKSLQNQYKRTRFLNSHQSRKFGIESKHLNKINNNNNNSTNRPNLCRPEHFTHSLQKENKPKKPSEYSDEDDLCSTMKKSKKQRSVLSSTIHNSQSRRVSSKSNSRVRSSLKVRNKGLDKNEYNQNDSINHHIHFDHHERRLHSSNNQRTQRSQSPIENRINTIKDSDYNRSIHSPISYFLDFNDKPDYNQHCTNLHSEYFPINKQHADSPTYINSEYADNLPKAFHSTELQTENHSNENGLHNKSIHSRRNNLHTIHPNSSFYRNSDLYSGSLDRLRRRCHSIERELGSIERDKYEQGLNNPISGDPRVDALTSANRILRQRLHDIQKLQENREHALNKAHEMVNGLLNKQQKQASIIRESTRNFAQTPSTLLTNNHDIDDDHNRKSYITNLYKPVIKDDSFNLPTYTPTKYRHYHNQHHLQCHHDVNHITDHYDRNYNQHSPYNHCSNQRKPFNSRNNSTNLLLEKLRSDYADLANSVCRIEEKARDAASSVQSLLRQFQMGLMEPVNFSSMNQLPNSDSHESFNRESYSNELYDKSVMLRLQKARDTLDQLKSDSFRPSINLQRQVDYTVPLTISVTPTTNSLLSSSIPVMTTTSGTVPSKMNHYNLHEPHLKHPNVYNRPYTNSLRSTWHIS